MSIRGDVPIPCFNSRFCDRAGDGQNRCDPYSKHCSNPSDPYRLEYDPLGGCGRKFRYPAQGTMGSRADLGGPTQHEEPLTVDPLTWNRTLESMMYDTLHWNSVTVPSETDPTFWQKFRYVYLGTQTRVYIVSLLLILLSILIVIL